MNAVTPLIMLIISNVLSTLATVFEYGARIVQAVIIIENIPQNTVISVAIVSIIILLIKLLIKSKALVFIGTNWKIYLTYYLTHSPREGCLMSATSIPIFTYKYTSNTTLSILQIHIKLTEHNKLRTILRLGLISIT